MSTYSPIASQTLSANAGSVTFNNIPQGYTDLVIVFKGTGASSTGCSLQFNGDTAANYARAYLFANGSSNTSGRETGVGNISFSVMSGVGHTIININGYSNINKWKNALIHNDYYSNATVRSTGVWRNTAAITSIKFTGDSANITSGSVISIYGLAGGQSATKASGGIITTSGAYTYHTFLTSGSFLPNENMTVDYLVVGGGGGGGAGGGGAGGLRSTVTATGGGGTLETAISLTAGISYPAIVGGGGVGGIAYSAGASNGTNGSFSAFGSIYSLGGGGGGSAGGGTGTPLTGGSGGGASYSSGQAYPGLGTAGQGYDGGQDTQDAPPYVGPGGGGAGQVGQNPVNSSIAGAGGNGVQITALATPTSTGANGGYYAGGGGGFGYGGGTAGAGGLGGGGAGNVNAGTANTGGGGGAGANGAQAAQGGSGIIIVRYLT